MNGQMDILPLFMRGKLGTSKIDYVNKIRKSHVCLHYQARNSVPITGSMTGSG